MVRVVRDWEIGKTRKKKTKKVHAKQLKTVESTEWNMDNGEYSSWIDGAFVTSGTKAVYSRKGHAKPEDIKQEKRKKEVFGSSITPEGKIQLLEKLEDLKQKRSSLAENSANAESKFEKQQYMLEKSSLEVQIKDIEYILASTRISEANENFPFAKIGHSVKLHFLDDKVVENYRLVGSAEFAAIDSIDAISDISPLGKAILGKKEGTVVNYCVGDEQISVKILSIS